LAFCLTVNATDRYVSPSGGHIVPFTDWASAATNIQAAIDAASAGDVVWVTNGVYSSGGKVMAGDLTNRVALDKALTVQSVNGAAVTIIEGARDPSTTNGPLAVRCAWLTNGAALRGVTLRYGATRAVGDLITLRNGGGVWCASEAATLTDCVVTNNFASLRGAGTYQGTLNNCSIIGNSTSLGGGSYFANLNNCLLLRNSAAQDGGGSYYGTLSNCLLIENSANNGYGGGSYNGTLNNCALLRNTTKFQGGGSYNGTLNNCTLAGNKGPNIGIGAHLGTLKNCILWNNNDPSGFPENYVSPTTLINCCTKPLPSSGSNNIVADPQFLADGIHLAATSPCRAAGSALFTTGTDIDGQSWTNPPSIGCDDWQPQPTVVGQPRPRAAIGNGEARIEVLVAGTQPFCWWTKDGARVDDGSHYGEANTVSLLVRGFGIEDAGNYQVVVSNAFGMVTSQVARVTVNCVDAAGTSPASPYTNWATAATTIQNAVDAAADTNAVILVTNGIYLSGGKVMEGDLTNRVAVAKAALVMSVNGPQETIIEGQWDASTNGLSAVRGVWLAENASLSGFTVRRGATRNRFTGPINNESGGGMWCASASSQLVNCVITNNSAASYGGGAYSATLRNSTVSGNVANDGGGLFSAILSYCRITENSARATGGGMERGEANNSVLTGNSAGGQGGGCYVSTLNNCTVSANRSGPASSAAYSSQLTNCIVWGNIAANNSPNFSGGTFSYSCTQPLPAGPGNISVDPQLVDGVHLAVTSSCRGAGNALFASGTDIDGEPWTNPPSMGCDEVWESALNGPLSVSLQSAWPEVVVNHALPLTALVTGRASNVEWSFGDGVVTNASNPTSHAWTDTGDFNVTFTASNNDNVSGVSTNLAVHVIPLEIPPLAFTGPSSNSLGFQFLGQPGVLYTLERATNLTPPVAWQTFRVFNGAGSTINTTDTTTGSPSRFYRLRVQ
jgi:hypothetical protein